MVKAYWAARGSFAFYILSDQVKACQTCQTLYLAPARASRQRSCHPTARWAATSGLSSQQDCISLALRAPWRDVCERGVLSEYPAARARASYWFDNIRQTLPGLPRAAWSSGRFAEGMIDGRRTSMILTLCSRSRCGAREAMTVGCKPTKA